MVTKLLISTTKSIKITGQMLIIALRTDGIETITVTADSIGTNKPLGN